jgi:hypothetical protein
MATTKEKGGDLLPLVGMFILSCLILVGVYLFL